MGSVGQRDSISYDWDGDNPTYHAQLIHHQIARAAISFKGNWLHSGMIIFHSLSANQALLFVVCAKNARMIIGRWTVY